MENPASWTEVHHTINNWLEPCLTEPEFKSKSTNPNDFISFGASLAYQIYRDPNQALPTDADWIIIEAIVSWHKDFLANNAFSSLPNAIYTALAANKFPVPGKDELL